MANFGWAQVPLTRGTSHRTAPHLCHSCAQRLGSDQRRVLIWWSGSLRHRTASLDALHDKVFYSKCSGSNTVAHRLHPLALFVAIADWH